MEFDKNKILTVVTADQAKVGMRGWFANDIYSLKIYIERGDEPKGLQSVDFHNEYPFRESYPSDGSFACKYRYFYPVPEPTYAERQAQWVKENGLKVGDEVWITRPWEAGEDGADCAACYRSSGMVDAVVNVKEIREKYILIEENTFSTHLTCPYTALGIIKEPSYRPFTNDELNDIVGKVVTSKLTGDNRMVSERASHNLVHIGGSQYTAENLLEWYTLEGHPCGVRKES